MTVAQLQEIAVLGRRSRQREHFKKIKLDAGGIALRRGGVCNHGYLLAAVLVALTLRAASAEQL
jgi:hypothetical protein